MKWTGAGLDERLTGVDASSGKEIVLVEIRPEFLRPGEVPFLRGDSTKIKNEIGWQPSKCKSWQ